MPARSILLAILVAVLWGGNFVALKIATDQFPPIFMLSLRFACVAALMLPFVKTPPRCLLPGILAVSFSLGGLHFGPMFTGLARVEASTGAIATQLGVPFSVLLAVLLLKDRLGLRRIAGIVLAFAGVAVLAGGGDLMADWIGLGFIFVGAFFWAVANNVIKYFGPFDPYMLTGWMSLFAAPQLFGMSLMVEQGQWISVTIASWHAWAAFAYMVVAVSIIGYSLWYALINNNPLSQVVPFTLLAPVFGVTLAVIMLGDVLTLPLLLGGAMTLVGVGLCEINVRWLPWKQRRATECPRATVDQSEKA